MPLPPAKPAIPDAVAAKGDDKAKTEGGRTQGAKTQGAKTEGAKTEGTKTEAASPTPRRRRRRRAGRPSRPNRTEHAPAYERGRPAAAAPAHPTKTTRSGAASRARSRRSSAGAPSRLWRTVQHAQSKATPRRALCRPSPVRRRAAAQGSAAADADRSPPQAAPRARPDRDRRPPRPAWPHPERGARGAVALPAPRAGRRRQDRAGDHRQGRPRATGAACSGARCRSGSRCRNSALLCSRSRPRTPPTAARARSMCGCGAGR